MHPSEDHLACEFELEAIVVENREEFLVQVCEIEQLELFSGRHILHFIFLTDKFL